MYRTILVPLDGSAFGEHALPLALNVASKSGAELLLVHALPPLAAMYTETPLFVSPSVEEDLRTKQVAVHKSYLEHVAKRLTEAAPVRVRTELLEGDVVNSIIATAENQADLIVMTTHGRGALARFWLGSVADEVIRHAKKPILLVRPKDGPVDLASKPELKHLLVSLDGMPLAEKILPAARQLGDLFGADYTLARVIPPVLTPSYPILEGASFMAEAESLVAQTEAVQNQLRKEAQDYLEGIAAGMRAQGRTVLTRVDVHEQPARALLEEAKAVDVVAIETHGRGGLARMFLGSVADKVIRGTTTAVLIQRPAEK
jgi:nucleotide-binding universal stress UspA family protein